MTADQDLPARLRSGESLGGWCSIPNALTTEIIGRTGFDWICVDAQHGAIDRAAAESMLRALDAAGVPGLVRVPSNDAQEITQALDSGAAGVIVPLVNDARQAAAAAQSMRYPPAGARSFGPTRASVVDSSYRAAVSDVSAVCAVQIETGEAVDNAAAIAAVRGVDVLLVGPADLALSLGMPVGAIREPAFRVAARRVVAACRANGKVAAMFCGTMDAIGPAREDGFTMLAVQSDVRLLRQAAAAALEEARRLR